MKPDNVFWTEKMAESIDEILVDNGIEKPRKHVIDKNSLITKLMGLKVTKRTAPRVKIQFELVKDKPLESFFAVVYQNCSCRFRMTDCSMLAPDNINTPKPIVKIQMFIKQMWRNNQDIFFQILDNLYATTTDKINQIMANQRQNPK